jgi:hypothetical protein
MSGWWRALSSTLALAFLSLLTAGCGSNANVTHVRLVNAIPDSQPIDVYINGTIIATNLAFGAVDPNTSPASYISVTSGTESLQSFPRGSTTNPITPTGTLSLNGSEDYTVIGVGLEANSAAPLVLADNNLPPTSGNVEFRVVNLSINSPTGGVDVYFVAPGTDITGYAPQVTALSQSQASNYQALPYLAGGYEVIVTKNGGKTPLIDQTYNVVSGSITTLLLVDNAGGNNGISQTPLVLNDLN